LADITQEALNVGYQGAIIETLNPDEAWSDAVQQITPEVLAELIEFKSKKYKSCRL
jgi:chorismate mutase